MKLSDMGEISRKVLSALGDLRQSTRRELSAATRLTPPQVSSALSRLENFGLITSPEEVGSPWTITPDGLQMLGLGPEPEPGPNASIPETAVIRYPLSAIIESEPEPEPEPELPNEHQGFDPEIERALDQLRARLHPVTIPPMAAQVYAEVLAQLPLVLRQTLAPVTFLVESFRE